MDKTKWIKFAKGAAIAAAGAVLAYVSSTVIPDLQAGGAVTLAAVLAMGVNLIKLLLSKSDNE